MAREKITTIRQALKGMKAGQTKTVKTGPGKRDRTTIRKARPSNVKPLGQHQVVKRRAKTIGPK